MAEILQEILPTGYQLHWYEFGSVLGQGGFGITYAGFDKNLNQNIAIKEYFPKAYAARDTSGKILTKKIYRGGADAGPFQPSQYCPGL